MARKKSPSRPTRRQRRNPAPPIPYPINFSKLKRGKELKEATGLGYFIELLREEMELDERDAYWRRVAWAMIRVTEQAFRVLEERGWLEDDAALQVLRAAREWVEGESLPQENVETMYAGNRMIRAILQQKRPGNRMRRAQTTLDEAVYAILSYIMVHYHYADWVERKAVFDPMNWGHVLGSLWSFLMVVGEEEKAAEAQVLGSFRHALEHWS